MVRQPFGEKEIEAPPVGRRLDEEGMPPRRAGGR
jgi:hypothetical protein